MSEFGKTDIEIIKTRLSEIDSKLGSIERQLSKSKTTTWYHFFYGVGLVCMVAGMGVSIGGLENAIAALILFILGLLMFLAAPLLARRIR